MRPLRKSPMGAAASGAGVFGSRAAVRPRVVPGGAIVKVIGMSGPRRVDREPGLGHVQPDVLAKAAAAYEGQQVRAGRLSVPVTAVAHEGVRVVHALDHAGFRLPGNG